MCPLLSLVCVGISAMDISWLLLVSNSARISVDSGSNVGLRERAAGALFLLPLHHSAVKL